MTTKNKITAIILTAVIILISIIVIGYFPSSFLLPILTHQKLRYNTSVFKVGEKPTAEILFARDPDGYRVKAYRIRADGTGLKYLGIKEEGSWQDKSLGGSLFENMGTYIGESQIGDKKIEINKGGQELTLVDKGKKKVLERNTSLFSILGIKQVQWLSDGRHLVIEDYNQQIGIYDTTSRKYYYVTDGTMPIPTSNIEK